ncbi:MAG: methyltransferase [Longicatena sp.]
MDHYFTDNRHLAENRKEISFRFWCINYSFLTDNGVFSKSGVDFGTRVLLEAICEREELGNNVLDVGCGYGPIGITLKKIYPDSLFEMVDVNPRAVLLACDNANKNGVEVNIHESNVYESVNGNTFTDIITNPPIRAGKRVIYKIFEEAYQHLSKEGKLWVVIRKQQGALSAVDKIKDVFGNCDIIKKEKGYFILYAKKH